MLCHLMITSVLSLISTCPFASITRQESQWNKATDLLAAIVHLQYLGCSQVFAVSQSVLKPETQAFQAYHGNARQVLGRAYQRRHKDCVSRAHGSELETYVEVEPDAEYYIRIETDYEGKGKVHFSIDGADLGALAPSLRKRILLEP